jgi:hypothetical protein
MAVVYDRKDINIEYFSKFNLDENRYNKQLIIYPVLSYKVYAPVIEDIKLNVFQKNILSILNKGNYSINEISNWLKLDRLLVQTILAELNNFGYFDGSKNIITKQGKDLIEGKFSWFENAENMRQDIRYIYQDIYTHKLYPLLMPMNNNSVSLYLKADKFHYKTMGVYDTFDYSLVEAKVKFHQINKPNNDEIFEAINEHIKQFTSTKNDLKEKPSAIQFLDSEPTLVYLAVWAYINKDNKNLDEFEVIDPFGIYEDVFWLKEGIEITDIDSLEELVIDVKNRDQEKLSDSLKSLYQEVEKEILKSFHYSIENHPPLYEGLKELYSDIKQYELDKQDKHLKNAYIKSQIILETLFGIVQSNRSRGYVDVLQSSSRTQLNRVDINEVKTKIHRINPSINFPSQWNSYQGGNFQGMYRAINEPKKASLRALYVTAILASFYDDKNVMYKLLMQEVDILIFFEELAQKRNDVSHKHKTIKEHEKQKYYEDVLDIKEKIEQIITIFLEGDR